MPKPNLYFRFLLSAAAIIGIVFIGLPRQVLAVAAPPLSGGITVAPAYVTAQVGSKQPQTSVTVGVRNNFNTPITISAGVSDINIHNNSLVLANNLASSLSDIITISPTQAEINPGSSINFIVTITNKSSLSPGGHYLSLLLSQTSSDINNATPKLSLKPAVSATIYLIKEDGALRSVKVTKVRLSRSIFSVPKQVDVTFYNNGNVVTVPRGVVSISDRSRDGKIYAQGVVNASSIPLQPKSSVTFAVALKSFAPFSLLERYHLNLIYRPDGIDKTSSITQTFWYISKSAIFLGLILLLCTSLFIHRPSRKYILAEINYRWRRRPVKKYVAPVSPVDPLKVSARVVTNKSKKIKVKYSEKIIPNDHK